MAGALPVRWPAPTTTGLRVQGELAFRAQSYTPWPVDSAFEGQRLRIPVGPVQGRTPRTYVFKRSTSFSLRISVSTRALWCIGRQSALADEGLTLVYLTSVQGKRMATLLYFQAAESWCGCTILSPAAISC